MGIKEWLASDSILDGLKEMAKAKPIENIKDKLETTKLQAMAAEGGAQNMDIENLLFATSTGKTIGGVKNNYSTYDQQVYETYRKYNGEATWGNQQARAVADIRSAFISGAGLSVGSENDAFNEWYKNFIKNNRVLNSRFFDAVLGTEMTGKCLFYQRVEVPGEYPKVLRVPYTPQNKYQVKLANDYDPDSVIDVVKVKDGREVSLGLENFVYIRTGGDDRDVNKTTTRVGVVLNDIENYDRALKDLRQTNHVASRVTPTFETQSEKETKEIASSIRKSNWNIGKTFIGTAKLRYVAPGTGSVDNLKSEMATSIKTIAAVTGVPVHWIGWTDLMANRSTADSLYETLKNATVRERTIISEGIYDLIVKAQEIYIDNGGTDITEVVRDFEVEIPIIDMTIFLDMVKGLHLAYQDGVISKMDYQNRIPGIDPIQTNNSLELEGQSGEGDNNGGEQTE